MQIELNALDKSATRDEECGIWESDTRIPMVKLKIPGKAFLKSESRISKILFSKFLIPPSGLAQ